MRIISYFLFMVFVLTMQWSVAQTKGDTIDVLFVGNSFTFFNNLPHLVSSMAESQGYVIRTSQSTVGGSNLGQHWNREKETKTMDLLENQSWDIVVFNNHSSSSLDQPEEFIQYGQLFAQKVKSLGAKPVFMITWAYRSNPLMQDEITQMHERLADSTGADLVPCGPLMAEARHWRPDLGYFADDKHPSPLASYMFALLFYRYFSGDSVLNIPDRLLSKDQYGQKLYLAIINKSDGDFLRELVDTFPIDQFINIKD